MEMKNPRGSSPVESASIIRLAFCCVIDVVASRI